MSRTSSSTAKAFMNVVLIDKNSGCKATLGGCVIEGNEKKPSNTMENQSWKFVLQAKANAAKKANDLEPGQAVVLLKPDEFAAILNRKGIEIALEVRDARPVEEQDEDSGDDWD